MLLDVVRKIFFQHGFKMLESVDWRCLPTKTISFSCNSSEKEPPGKLLSTEWAALFCCWLSYASQSIKLTKSFCSCILRWLYLRCKARHLNLPPNDLSFTWRSLKMSPFVLVCHCSVNWCLFNTLVLSDAFLPWIHLFAQFGRIATAWINDSKISENYRSHILH